MFVSSLSKNHWTSQYSIAYSLVISAGDRTRGNHADECVPYPDIFCKMHYPWNFKWKHLRNSCIIFLEPPDYSVMLKSEHDVFVLIMYLLENISFLPVGKYSWQHILQRCFSRCRVMGFFPLQFSLHFFFFFLARNKLMGGEVSLHFEKIN